MFISTNQLKSLLPYYQQQLDNIYEPNEVMQLFYLMAFFNFGCEKVDIKTKDIKLSESDLLKQKEIVSRLKNGEPIQYVLGQIEFFDLILDINSSVLIPRPETEELVNLILNSHKEENLDILDIGTGSGCIPLALKSVKNNWHIAGLDISKEALSVAKTNSKRLDINIKWIQKDILSENISDEIRFDIIISNPPYVLESDKLEMAVNVLDHEPHLALFVSDSAPLLFYKRIIYLSKSNLKSGGALYFEIHEKFGIDIKKEMELHGYTNVRIVKDLQGKDRIISGILS